MDTGICDTDRVESATVCELTGCSGEVETEMENISTIQIKNNAKLNKHNLKLNIDKEGDLNLQNEVGIISVNTDAK